MPMKMGIHRTPLGYSQSTLLDSRLRGNDGGMCFPEKYINPPLTLQFTVMFRLDGVRVDEIVLEVRDRL